MARNRSLDEFAATDARVSMTADGEAEERTDPSDGLAEPLRATYAWDPDGGPCDACGGDADERWRDGDALVCPACKSW